jgi:hypothetical protein
MNIQQQVEQDYGQPFWDVVKAFADDGESINATALMLGYAQPPAFHRLVAAHGVQHWFNPATQTNSYKAAKAYKEVTPARMEQLQSLKEQHKFEFRGVIDTRAGHARRMGLSPNTVATRLRKGWTLEKALTLPTHASAYRPEKRNNQQHPWRATQ